ncbi:hypothetical protein OROMI_024625 [Orobanche minor]
MHSTSEQKRLSSRVVTKIFFSNYYPSCSYGPMLLFKVLVILLRAILKLSKVKG